MKIDGFIDEILVGQIGRVQDIGKGGGKDCHYLSFTLICAGIEFLAACFDDHPFDEQGHSKKRFKCAIEELFPDKYYEHADKLYGSLRCGLAHVALPKSDIGLTQLKESEKFGTKHLVEHSERLTLISETFFSDFVSGCEKLKTKIKEGELTDTKLQGDFFSVPEEVLHNIGSSVTSPPVSGSCKDTQNNNLKRILKQGGKPQKGTK